jgi:hypothetical protein
VAATDETLGAVVVVVVGAVVVVVVGGGGGGGGAVGGGAGATVVGTMAALADASWCFLVSLDELDPDWASWTPRAPTASAELARTMGIETDADGCCLRILRLLEVTGARRASGVAWECGQPVGRMLLASRYPPGRLGTMLRSVRGADGTTLLMRWLLVGWRLLVCCRALVVGRAVHDALRDDPSD